MCLIVCRCLTLFDVHRCAVCPARRSAVYSGPAGRSPETRFFPRIYTPLCVAVGLYSYPLTHSRHALLVELDRGADEGLGGGLDARAQQHRLQHDRHVRAAPLDEFEVGGGEAIGAAAAARGLRGRTVGRTVGRTSTVAAAQEVLPIYRPHRLSLLGRRHATERLVCDGIPFGQR